MELCFSCTGISVCWIVPYSSNLSCKAACCNYHTATTHKYIVSQSQHSALAKPWLTRHRHVDNITTVCADCREEQSLPNTVCSCGRGLRLAIVWLCLIPHTILCCERRQLTSMAPVKLHGPYYWAIRILSRICNKRCHLQMTKTESSALYNSCLLSSPFTVTN